MSFGHLTGLRFIELADPLMIIGSNCGFKLCKKVKFRIGGLVEFRVGTEESVMRR